MEKNPKIDVIVIGAGPSGVACATVAARYGLKVLVIEKASHFGVKNVYGGAVYLESIKELFPKTYKNCPYERFLKKHNFVILNGNNSINVSYENNEDEKTSATITRFAFDSFLAEEARKEGVYFAPETLVTSLIKKGNKIIGVKTETEEIFAPVVVIAEGFNSILLNEANLKKKTSPKSAILGVKETIRLGEETIKQRFQLKENEGSMYEFFGGLNKEGEDIPFSMGFLYTFKNTVSIGVGVSMETLQKNKVKPYEYLNRLKNNEFVKNLIDGGELVEYSAHSIPEGGYNELPEIFGDGYLIVGDAANLVDSVHFEGTNLAIKSGIVAGETIIEAYKKKNFTKKILKNYKKKLNETFVIKDLKTYKNVIPTLLKRKNSIFSYYPKKIDEYFKLWTTANNKGKKQGYRNFLLSFFKERKPKELMQDVISFVKCAIEAII